LPEEKIESLVKRLKKILEEAGCYYLVTIAMKSSSLKKDNFRTFGKGPVMQLIADTLATIEEKDMSDVSFNKSFIGEDN